jgi:hypothetical protein
MALRNEILRRRIARLTRLSVRAGEADELEAAE